MAINILDAEQSTDLCSICQHDLNPNDSNIYELPECKHKFHTSCIVTWFRCGQQACPLCGNKGINHGGPADKWYNSSYKKIYALSEKRGELKKWATKNPNVKGAKMILKKLEQYQKANNNIKQLEKELKEYKNSLKNTPVILSDYRKVMSSFKNKKWTQRSKIMRIAHYINNIPIIPIILPTFVDLH